jgi:hypothetical protein
MADGFLSGLARRVIDVRDTAEEYGRDTAGRLRHRGDDARGELRRLWSQLEDLVERNLGATPSDAAQSAARSARHYAQDGRDLAYDLADQVRAATRARPLLAIGIAVAATVIVTSLLSGGRRR